MQRPPCPRCLLDETGEAALAQSVRAYINTLPDAQRADAATVQARLAVCQGCEQLLSGMCRLCGCFVEARAAKANQRCPMPGDKWKAILVPTATRSDVTD